MRCVKVQLLPLLGEQPMPFVRKASRFVRGPLSLVGRSLPS